MRTCPFASSILVMLAQMALPAAVAAQQQIPVGAWHAWLDSPGGELPFALEVTRTRPKQSQALERSEGGIRVVIRNGAERIPVPIATFADGELELGIDYYDSRIVATLDPSGSRFDGTWTKRRGGAKLVSMTFHATHGPRPRFAVAKPTRAAAAVTGRYRVKFEKDEHPSVGIFAAAADGGLTGTFLTTLGDYRYLAGNWGSGGEGAHGILRLSCFDGAHAFLCARVEPDGTLRGDFWSSDTWHESWTAVRDASASLPDAWKLTQADSNADVLGRLRFPGLDGKARSLADPAFAGKARVLIVLGTWCPNCRDASRYLAELHRRYRDRGLSVVGLAFEHSGDRERDLRQVALYVKRQKIEFPILLAGLSDKRKASQALPILDRVRSYPTTVFMRGDGSVRAVHTGFTGPGAAEDHAALRRRFESVIEELLRGGANATRR